MLCNTVTISVIVPIYNGEQYIENCCKQLINQTIDNLEIILVDDGSTDNTKIICNRMCEKYSNCRSFSQDKLGVSAARNLGIEKAKGEYLGFVDVDDEYDNDMYEVLYKIAKNHSLDVVCMDNIGEANSLNVFSDPEEILRLFLKSKIRISACYKIFKRELYPQFSFPIGVQIYEDCMAVYRALTHSKAVGCINICKYHYVQHEGSNSRAPRFTAKYLDAIHVVDAITKEVEINYPMLREECTRRKAITYLRITKVYYLRGCPNEFKTEILSIRNWLSKIPITKLSKYYGTFDCIRYLCYFYCKPVFLLIIKTVDKK